MDYSKPTLVISKDGARGTLVEAASAGSDPTHVLVQFETGQQVLVPLDALTLQADGSYYYLALRQDELVNRRTLGTQHPDDPLVLPVVAEHVICTSIRESLAAYESTKPSRSAKS
jgi:hypothetical protein